MSIDTKAEPLDLPLIDAVALAAQNTLVGMHRRIELPIAGGDASVSFNVEGPSNDRDFVRFRTAWGDLWLSLEPLCEIAARRDLAGVDLDRLPPDLLPAVLASLLEEDIDRLAALAGGACEVLSVSPASELPERVLRVGCSVADASGSLTVSIRAEASTLQQLAAAVAGVPPLPARSLGELPLDAWVEVGMTVLPAEEMRSVRSGDVLLIDVAAPEDRPVGVMRLGSRIAYTVHLRDDGVEVIDQIPTSESPEPPADALSLRVVFAKGPIRLSAAEATRLVPGTTLPLPNDAVLYARVGRSIIGVGELVSIAGHRGVRMNEAVLQA